MKQKKAFEKKTRHKGETTINNTTSFSRNVLSWVTLKKKVGKNFWIINYMWHGQVTYARHTFPSWKNELAALFPPPQKLGHVLINKKEKCSKEP